MTPPSLTDLSLPRPHTTLVLAMSADGKIADFKQSPARFGSITDKHHLETQIAQADAVLFGAGTLRAYGTTLRLTDSLLLQKRQQLGKSLQPIQIVCSSSARLDPQMRFFQQPVPRWLLTSVAGAGCWQAGVEFERVLTFVEKAAFQAGSSIDWTKTLPQLCQLGIERLVVMGGSTLVADLLATDLLDEFWLTICPLILGGKQAPSPVAGMGFLEADAPRLELLDCRAVEQEVFLHYRRKRGSE